MVVPAQAIGVARTASQRRSARRRSAPSESMPPQQHRELLATPAGQQLVGGELAGEPPRELDQHRVADGVPVDVVDLLEVVGVEQQQRAARRVERALGGHELGEVAPVVAPGQLVRARQQLGLPVRATQLLLQAPALGDVARDAVVEQRAVRARARAQPVEHDPLDAVDARRSGTRARPARRAGRRRRPRPSARGPRDAAASPTRRRRVLGHAARRPAPRGAGRGRRRCCCRRRGRASV